MINQDLGSCVADLIASGVGKCPIGDMGDVEGYGLLPLGEKIGTSIASLTETAFRGLQSSGKLHQLLKVDDFQDTTPENERFTSPKGFMEVVRDAKVMHTVTFRNGKCFDRALQSLKGKDRWSVLIYYTKGVRLTTDSQKLNLKGFSTKMLDADVYKSKSGSEVEFSKMYLQYRDTNEFNELDIFIPYDVLGFNPLEIDDPIQTVVVMNNLVAGTNITLDIVDNCNSAVSYAELLDTVGLWAFTKNGADLTASAVAQVGGKLSFTVGAIASDDVITASLDGIQLDDNGVAYTSIKDTKTVA